MQLDISLVSFLKYSFILNEENFVTHIVKKLCKFAATQPLVFSSVSVLQKHSRYLWVLELNGILFNPF